MLQATNIVQPDGSSLTHEYCLTGLLARIYGSRSYPVGYGYDAQGRMTSMTNWTTFDPAGPGSGERVTTWNYEPYRGWLSTKRYADNYGPDYEYKASGRLLSRAWARGTPRITTTYAYNNAGDLWTVSYTNDTTGTQDLTYTYDRRGRRATVVLGSMTTTLYFNEANQLIGESYSGGTLGGLAMTNLYDAYLRRTYLAAKKGTSTLASAAFGYDTGSRLSTVTDGTWNSTYTYLANSPLVSQITHKQSTTTRMTDTRQYDLLNRLTSISSTPAGAGQLPVGFVYQYNDANQRTRGTLEDGSFWIYEYDRLGQVVSGKRYWMDGSPVPAQQFEYGFDDIGNRTSTMAGGDSMGAGLRSASYLANTLNQYTSRTVPGAFDVSGVANANETATVNGSAADYRRGEYFQELVNVDNSSAIVWSTVTATTSGGGSTSGKVFVPQTPENYVYDFDGNLTSDGHWTYVWDAENRLIQMTPLAGIPDADQRRLNFAYDHQGRRIWKRVDYKVGGNWTTFYERKFVYDGWNLIAELFTNDGVVKKFLWGLDLSGTEQGAGGVGGLLKEWDFYTWKDYFAGYDGNGNVTLLTAGSDGTVAARFEYGPFGEAIRSSGSSTIAASTGAGNPFRFSTKYTDAESDLLYYGYRYYNPSTGRWLSRDPIADLGFSVSSAQSLNSETRMRALSRRPSGRDYLCLDNSLIAATDSLGLTKWSGECAIYGMGIHIGPLFIECYLESDCTIDPDNHREVVHVKAYLFKAEVGLPVGYSEFHAAFTSPKGSDHNAFRGWAEAYGAGFAVGKGYHLEAMTLGSAVSDHLVSAQSGADLGMLMAKGRSYVRRWHKECCDGKSSISRP